MEKTQKQETKMKKTAEICKAVALVAALAGIVVTTTAAVASNI